MVIGFILGFLACYLLAYFERRELRADYRKIVNEWSIRTGGRTVYQEPQKNEKIGGEPEIDRGQFRIMTGSMAELEAEEAAERAEQNGNGEMSEEDLEHLRVQGIIR